MEPSKRKRHRYVLTEAQADSVVFAQGAWYQKHDEPRKSRARRNRTPSAKWIIEKAMTLGLAEMIRRGEAAEQNGERFSPPMQGRGLGGEPRFG